MYLSKIDDLDSVAANESVATVGLTSGFTATVEPTAQAKVKPTGELFPYPPQQIDGNSNIQSKVVVVPKTKPPNKPKQRDSRNSRNSHRDKNHNRNSYKKPRHHSASCDSKREANRKSNREKLRQAVKRVKERAEKFVPPRQIEFIANPPVAAKPPNRSTKQPVFGRLGPSIAKPLANYHIPKKSVVVNTQIKPHSTKPKPNTESKAAVELSPAKLSRTQIKNRNRRLAFKRMREQQTQPSQQQ